MKTRLVMLLGLLSLVGSLSAEVQPQRNEWNQSAPSAQLYAKRFRRCLLD